MPPQGAFASFHLFLPKKTGLLYKIIQWYVQRFDFPFRGWKYFRRLLRLTGNEHKVFRKKLHNGQWIQVSPHDHIQQQIFWYGFYEKKYLLAWERMVAEDSVVVDIGANIGYYSLVAAAKARAGKVFAFEPHRGSFRQLQDNIQLNGLTNIEPVPFAVTRSAGTTSLFLAPADNSGMTSLQRGGGPDWNTQPITTLSLDTWAEERNINRIDLIKMDIEGSELEALNGMTTVLQQKRPAILIEIADVLLRRHGGCKEDVYALMKKFGYRPFRVMEDSSLQPAPEGLEDELVVFLPDT